MAYRRSRRPCRCAQSSLPSSTTLLFLSIVLPASSFAQLSNPGDPPKSTASNSPPNPAKSNSPRPETSTSSSSSNNGLPGHVYYYFLIVGCVAVLFCACILYAGHQKRQKAALLQSHGQTALARDVEGFRSRFGIRRIGVNGNGIHGVGERELGLNERGEAPPPYVPRSKPPSIRSTDGREANTSHGSSIGEEVELGRISTGMSRPPVYHEHIGLDSEGIVVGVTSPEAVVTAPERSQSNTARSSQA